MKTREGTEKNKDYGLLYALCVTSVPSVLKMIVLITRSSLHHSLLS